VCAFPNCEKPLVGPDSSEDSGAVIAELAHIVADSRQGPRGGASLSDEQRNSHENIIVLCRNHHGTVDSQPNTYSIEVLRQMKKDHLDRVRARMHPETPPVAERALITEQMQSSVLTVTHLPQAVYEADCAFGPGEEEEVRTRLSVVTDHEVLYPFVLADGKVFCFQATTDRSNPFSGVIDRRTARARDAKQMWQDDDGRRLYVRLLNRSLFKYAGHRGVRFDPGHRRFYFVPNEKGKAKSVEFTSLAGRRSERSVVWRPIRKSTGQPTSIWWHVAVGLRFHFLAPMQWCLSIRPEYHLTSDGEAPLESTQIGRRIARKKSRMFNHAYLREINFWRDFLSQGKPRILLNFEDQAAAISSELLTILVEWPGIPGDAVPFQSAARSDDLFSLAQFQEAVGGDDVEWDQDDEEPDEDEAEEAAEEVEEL
jgi:hypothetical protein